MYTIQQLRRYPYFDGLLNDGGLESVLDPLTGVVARHHMLGFVRALIDAGTPFTFGMIDLDNFKFINDNYGHHAGDRVLVEVARSLARYMDGYGLVGRFGGDELLFVNLRDITYAEKKAFLSGAYLESGALRRNVDLEDCSPFITGTTGCATYPDDARDYDALFALIDKTLYRGKTKGRNCHIIYVEEKHKDIEIRRIARHGVYTTIHDLVRQFEMVPGIANKLQSVMPLLMEDIRISDLYYVGARGRLRAVCNGERDEDVSDIGNVMNDDVYATNALERIERNCPIFYSVLEKYRIETVMIVRVGMDMERYGYLICAEPRSRRIWQEDERAIIYFLAKLLAARIKIDGETLDGEG